MWTPFIIMGPGVKKGFKIKNPIRHVDQYATIMTLLERESNNEVDGTLLNDILK